MILLSTLFTLLLMAFILTLYALYNMLVKYEKLEDDITDMDDYVINLYNDLQLMYSKLVKLDTIGSFESDDETGFIFNQMKKSIKSISEKYNLDGTQEKE